jgi:hypothetical protein
VFAASSVWKGIAADFFKETPEVEVLDAAITINVMTGRALAQADQPQSVGISTGIFLSSAKIDEIVVSNLREASKVGSCDTCERPMW